MKCSDLAIRQVLLRSLAALVAFFLMITFFQGEHLSEPLDGQVTSKVRTGNPSANESVVQPASSAAPVAAGSTKEDVLPPEQSLVNTDLPPTHATDAPSVEASVSASFGTRNESVSSPLGFFILGMHRSGTSMLGGLLVEAQGYLINKPVLGEAPTNPRGHYEPIRLMNEDERQLNKQGLSWNADRLEHYQPIVQLFQEGKELVAWLNDPRNSPWMAKDPRLCVTLATWTHHLKAPPAIVMTIRHPASVARSHLSRDGFRYVKGLRLWIVYNQQALRLSQGLCRVATSDEAIVAHPVEEIRRIVEELTTRCRVPKPKQALNETVIDSFVDQKFQHQHATDQSFHLAQPGTSEYEEEESLFSRAMQLYEDVVSGRAFEASYSLPPIQSPPGSEQHR